MKLYVVFSASRKGVTTYSIRPALKPESSSPSQADLEHLAIVCPRIEKMARSEIGDSFLSLEVLEGFSVLLNVRVGTPAEKKFELSALLGWISLFASEKSL